MVGSGRRGRSRGARLGACALRSHLEDARARHPGDPTAARADGVDVDHGHAHGQAVAHLLSALTAGAPPTITPTSKLVPPMSHEITLPWPAASAVNAAAFTPAAGPDMSVLTAWRAATSTDMVPPLPCITRSSLVTLAGQLAGQPAQIAVDHGLNEPVDGRRRPALELPVLGEQLGAHREVRVRPVGGGQLASPALVGVVDVGVDEVDHQRLDAALAQPRRRAPHLVFIEGVTT